MKRNIPNTAILALILFGVQLRGEETLENHIDGAPSTASVGTRRSNDARVTGSSPNVILIMSDDQGWGDVGFNGNDVLKTPNLDEMAANGMVMERFHAASPICSPTRGSVLTGRYPSRYGVHSAHTSGMRVGEITLGNLLGDAGYRTGIFGKWHLGWVFPDEGLTRGHYSPPWHHGFQESFVTSSAVPTWDPGITPLNWNSWGGNPGEPWKGGMPYNHNGSPVSENMQGCDSRIIMDRAIPFIRQSVSEEMPFLVLIWFHAPHEPVVAGPDYLAIYEDLAEEQAHYYGTLTAMDEQIGRLRQELRDLGVAENTLVSFTSDNGAARGLVRRGHASSGPFRGHKHMPHEGGTRVPTVFEWPGTIQPGRSGFLASTYDYFPTILDYLGLRMPGRRQRPLDGMSLATVFDGTMKDRPGFIVTGYQRLFRGHNRLAIMETRYKLIFADVADGATLEQLIPSPPLHLERRFGLRGHAFELYDLIEDAAETNNLVLSRRDEAVRLIRDLDKFLHSAHLSDMGADFEY